MSRKRTSFALVCLALAGRMGVLHKMGLRIAREAKIATYLKANADASRDDAIKATDAKK